MNLDGEGTAPEKRSDRTKSTILRAARERLAAQGYDRTTIRGVAADAGIDPSMVVRYFGSKAKLFDAALDIDLHLPDLTGVPLDQLPRILVLLRSAVTNDHAAARMREIFAAQVAPALAGALGQELAAQRAGLVSAQLLGLGLTRYLLRLPAVTA